ncbi:hypothetical protein PV325_013444, partial [Microctonus aethiopoides]
GDGARQFLSWPKTVVRGINGNGDYRFKQRIVRRRRDRLWIRRGAQTLDMEEERLLSHTMGDLEEYDFFGIRWMLDGNWGLPHPSSGWHCPGLVGSLQELADCEDVRIG